MMTSAVKTRRQTKPIKVELKPKPTKQSCIGSLIFSATVASTSPFGFFYLPSSGKNNSRKPPINHPPPPKHSSSPQLSSSSPSNSNPSSPNKSKPPSNVAHRNPKSPIQALGLGPKLPTRQRIFSSFSSSHKTKQARTASAFIQKTAVLEVENIVDSEGTSPKESTARSNHNVKQASEPILSNTRFSETESQNSTINSPVNAVANGSIGGMVRVSTGSPNDNGEGTGNTSTLGSMASGLNMSNENIKRRIYSAPVRPPPPKSLPKGMQKISESATYETWDDDFDADGNSDANYSIGLQIPENVRLSQLGVRQDLVNVKEFALLMQDLKSLYTEIKSLSSKPAITSNQRLPELLKIYGNDMEQVEVLVELSDCDEISPGGAPPRHASPHDDGESEELNFDTDDELESSENLKNSDSGPQPLQMKPKANQYDSNINLDDSLSALSLSRPGSQPPSPKRSLPPLPPSPTHNKPPPLNTNTSTFRQVQTLKSLILSSSSPIDPSLFSVLHNLEKTKANERIVMTTEMIPFLIESVRGVKGRLGIFMLELRVLES